MLKPPGLKLPFTYFIATYTVGKETIRNPTMSYFDIVNISDILYKKYYCVKCCASRSVLGESAET